MAFTRPTVSEKCYVKKYQVIDKSGNITEESSSTITVLPVALLEVVSMIQ